MDFGKIITALFLQMNANPSILFAITGLLVGGLLLFCSSGGPGTTDQNTPGKHQNQDRDVDPASKNLNSKHIATPFGEPLNAFESQAVEMPTGGSPGPTAQALDARDSPAPLQLIEDYLTAWSGNKQGEIQSIWSQISRCPECLQRIRELLMNQSVPQGMMLELTYKIIELGDPSMLPVFDYLLQSSVDMNTRIIITRQMINDGRAMYVKKLFDILQQADMDGFQEYAARQAWMISKLENLQGIEALFDVMSGRSGASERFAAHVRSVFNNTLLGINREGMAQAMVSYYAAAGAAEQQNLWSVISLHSESLMMLSKNAYEGGDLNHFKKYSEAMAAINSVSVIGHMLELASQVDYPKEYFVDMMRTSTQRFNNVEVFQQLEVRLLDPKADMGSRIVAAEGLLAVKNYESARFILEKALNSGNYEDSELAAYISARL